jgi:hypothetical protein
MILLIIKIEMLKQAISRVLFPGAAEEALPGR